jgi:hypothetical protein
MILQAIKRIAFKFIFIFLVLYFAYNQLASWYMASLYKDSPVVVCSPYGGTGNQLFRYAAAYTLGATHGGKIFIKRTKLFNKNSFSADDRELALGHFGIDVQNLLFSFLIKAVDPRDYVEVNHDNFHILMEKGLQNKFYNVIGIFKSVNFYDSKREEIRKLFNLKIDHTPLTKEFEKQIHNSNAVFVHIRKGDVEGLPLEYFKQKIEAAKKHIENPVFFVFTDSPEKVKGDLEGTPNLIFVSGLGLTSLQELYLMTQCKHGILSGGTFSYWATELGKKKEKIFTPSDCDMYPKDWIQSTAQTTDEP